MGAGGWGGWAKVTKGPQEIAEMGSISAITHGPFLPPEGQTETQGKSRSGLRSHCETPSSRVTSHFAGGAVEGGRDGGR